MLWKSLIILILATITAPTVAFADKKSPPAVGDTAPDFSLNDLNGQVVKLDNLAKGGPVVLLVLRGWPGYQCPLCTRQMGEFLGAADEFAARKATVLLIYPGPAKDLDRHAKEFIGGKNFPGHFKFVIDPDYTFVDLYGLRWNAPAETAYPSTFAMDSSRKVLFARVSKTHGGRSSAKEVIKALDPAGK